MTRTRFSSRLTRLAAALLCYAGLAGAALAQTPSADQIEIFRNLSEEQQQQILESLGRSGTGVRSDRGSDRTLRSPETQRRTGDERGRLRQRSDRELEDGIPRLQALDSLLLQLDIKQFQGQDVSTTPAPAPGAARAPTPNATPAAPTPPTTQQQTITPGTGKPIERTKAEEQRLEELRDRITRRNPLQLDKWGILLIPELGPIPLAGLTADEARQRLQSEPQFADFLVRVTFLPVDPVGAQALKPFGHELFERAQDTFAPATDIPVPAEYVIGPGDTFEVQFTGQFKGRFSLVVRRDGRVNLPEIGPIAVGGLRFDAARTALEERVAQQMIGTQVSVQMGELRFIQAFVVGDAKRPGSYTVSGLSTVTNALFVSGGVTKVGSLRNIELKRGGRIVTKFDLYDLLLRGDTQADLRLVSGDVIFIPPVGPVVGVGGEVRRPALYELRSERTVADVVKLAGGTTAQAQGSMATLERVGDGGKRTVIDIDLSAGGGSTPLRDGDILNIPTIRPTLEDSVVVQGHVHRPQEFQYRPGLRISDVLPTLEELKPMADQHYILIRREVPPTRRVEFVSADLVAALNNKGGKADIALTPRDQIYVFDLETGRDRLMQPLLRELRLQSTHAAPTTEVSVGGRVNAPGQYPLEPGMRISDLIRAGGSLNEAAYGGKAELTRNAIESGEVRETELLVIDLAKAMAGDPADDIELRPSDQLIVKELPLWGSQEYVEVQGEVRFPGRYPIQRGETLKSVVQRAGGITDLSFARGAVFTRETLKERERRQIEDLTKRMQMDLAQVSLMTAQESRGDAAQALAVGQQLLANLKDAEPVGRLVIDLNKSMDAAPGAAEDIVLKDGDRLLVPRTTQEVTVIGEVQSPTSHLFAENLARADYIELSGGTTQRADKSRIYVVRADGSVVSGGNSWFSGTGATIEPGDTVVVPLDAERMRALPLWTAVTTIIYNLAVAVAAVNSF
jgi:protein involved in polysaccharide export with SLBB domain